MTDTTDLSKRHIRSYVLRQGRVSPAQQRACDTLLPRFGIPYTAQPLDLDQAFGRTAPKILEIGFGMGDSTATIALAHPENDYLALEVHTPGVGNLLKLIDLQQIPNIRIIQHDAVEVLRNMLGEATLDGVHIFFPDPWHKARHNKRRLIQAPFVAQLVQKLKPACPDGTTSHSTRLPNNSSQVAGYELDRRGGYIHVATDWQDYAEQVLAVLSAEPLLENTAADYAPRPAYRPLTKFEKRGINLGHGVWDLVFRRK
ncbi:MAG: tRNA (guanosine(46)-N7)-methyltransferase TrmB [Gallionella sp.]|nr:tRNA (guanosine(46)-N7)-methyltransferase TrmB [Gallionella sp.]